LPPFKFDAGATGPATKRRGPVSFSYRSAPQSFTFAARRARGGEAALGAAFHIPPASRVAAVGRPMTKPPPDQPFFTVNEACAALRVSRSTLYALARAGRLPLHQLGARKRVAKADLERLLDAKE